MNYEFELTAVGIIHKGSNYPFNKPEGFDAWLKTKQEAFVQGFLHAYVGGETTTNQEYNPQKEVSL